MKIPLKVQKNNFLSLKKAKDTVGKKKTVCPQANKKQEKKYEI